MLAAKQILTIGIAWLAMLPAMTAMAQDRRDRRMDIINDTGRAVNNFYATNTTVKNWGRDLLGQDVIAPGQSYRLDFNDGTGHCVFDLRAVLDNGRFFERYRVNVCNESAWRLVGPGADTSPPPPSTSKRPTRPEQPPKGRPSPKSEQNI